MLHSGEPRIGSQTFPHEKIYKKSDLIHLKYDDENHCIHKIKRGQNGQFIGEKSVCKLNTTREVKIGRHVASCSDMFFYHSKVCKELSAMGCAMCLLIRRMKVFFKSSMSECVFS